MKRMYANEELVKLIQENAPKTEVDDALSATSENPVQNKVIYDALSNIPSGTQCYLHIGSIGGSQPENHDLKIIFIDANDSVTFDTLRDFLLNNSHIDYTSGYKGIVGNINFLGSSNELRVFDYSLGCAIYAKEASTTQIYFRYNGFRKATFTIADGAIVCSTSSQGLQSESSVNKSGFTFYGNTYQLLK